MNKQQKVNKLLSAENKEKLTWLEKGKNIWVFKEATNIQDAFIEAKVLDFNETSDVVQIELIEGQVKTTTILDKCFKLTYGATDVSDMVDLEELNEPQLLYNIKRRYFNDNIFTFCGPTLLILNPYMRIQKHFTENILHDYQVMAFSQSMQYKSQPPHVYALSAFCLWQLFDNQRNQSIVISGESGAGKTQNTKYCLNFLASLGRNVKEISAKRGAVFGNLNVDKVLKKISNKLAGIQDKILGCNEILEAFGNAKTIRNDNSSRFGKLILLLYGQTQLEIKSAFITNYLLEKSRIVSLSDGQRNYHIFYFFCKGASPEQRKKYKLTEPITGYYFLNQSSVYDVPCGPGKTDEDLFQLIKHEFTQYLTSEEIDAVLSIISSVLNLGNVKFSAKQNASKQHYIHVETPQFLKNTAEVLNIPVEDLTHNLTYKTRLLQGKTINSSLKLEESNALRDSLCKNLYEKLFNFLVFKLNEKIQLQKVDMDELGQNRNSRRSIGILDIFGFEILKRNSLQQFFINFANEKLQQLYVSYIFKQQQNQFLKQGLKQFAYQFDFEDNQPIIDIIESFPLGVLHLLSESSELNKSDNSLPQAIVKNHPKTTIIVIPKLKPDYFQVNHSCSPVEYQVTGFTAKNKDQFPAQMLSMVAKIENKALHSIINFELNKPDTSIKASKTSTKFLGTKFLQQMNRLIEELHSCDCHFVRCIKPNDIKKPKVFHSASVLQSLRNLGVLDSIRIRKLGYVYRRPFEEFYKKFYEVEGYSFGYNDVVKGFTEEDFKETVKKFVQKHAAKDVQANQILLGKQKIMIKEASLNFLEGLAKQKRRQRVDVANRIKRAFKRGKFRQHVSMFFLGLHILREKVRSFRLAVTEKQRQKKIVKIQKACRQFITIIKFKKVEKQAIHLNLLIGKRWKMIKQKQRYKKAKQNIVHLQSTVRMYLTKVKFFKQRVGKIMVNEILQKAWNIIRHKNAIKIQKIARGYITRNRYKALIADMKRKVQDAKKTIKIVKIQKWWRYIRFKKYMKKFVQAAQIIQAHWRRILLSRAYKLVKKSAIILQRATRKFLKRKYYTRVHWKNASSTFEAFEISRLRDILNLGLQMKTFRNLNKVFAEGQSRLQVASPAQTCFRYAADNESYKQMIECQESQQKKAEIDQLHTISNSIVNSSLNTTDRNDYQSYIIDLDMLTDISQYYQQWSEGYKACLLDMRNSGQLPIRYDVSDNFTLLTSQKGTIYAFGQVEPEDKLFTILDIKQPYKIMCNKFNGFVVNTDRRLYCWGDNYEDQLMMGEKQNKVSMAINSYLPMEKIDDLEVRGRQTYLISDRKVFEYESARRSGEDLYKLKKQVVFSDRIEVRMVAASNYFVHFVSFNGALYSKGINDQGQLGLGHTRNVTRPEINNVLRNKREIVDCVSVGFKHSICRTRLGYAYTWGDNSYKQVGGPDKFYTEPKLVDIDKPTSKCLHIAAGFRSSIILLQSLKIYGWGTNSTLSLTTQPVKIDVDKLLGINNMVANGVVPVKVSATWSNHMSIVYMNALQLNKCRKGTTTREMITKSARQLSKQWPHNAIHPIYNENAETHLNLSDIKKFKFKPYEMRQSSIPIQKKNSVEDMELLLQLRKNSASFTPTVKQKFEDALTTLLKKDVKEWTSQDTKMYQYLQNPKIQQFLKKL